MSASYQWALFASSLSGIGLEEFLDSCKSKHTEANHLDATTLNYPPPKPKLTLRMKQMGTTCPQYAKPNRFCHDILDRYESESLAKPTVNQVQKILSHHKRTKLKETEFVEDM
ncbi:Reversion-inducing cysteine-rich protein with Kazal motifs-like [Phytophthora palmivora]|uniref:Reversion-inducing cysteine-rich protein with Kazal motifs-like n=1 Tax=Phytophthora palmivora TaxID=4796 RepID=A0A2P4X5D0_9STRA|nr:Reversion-inducing cysteine-rich protein with Kazal motifs-like [Phytophthora palmivora]